MEACKEGGISIEKAILLVSIPKNRQHENINISLVSNQFTNNAINYATLKAPINIKFSSREVYHFKNEYYKHGDLFINEINATRLKII